MSVKKQELPVNSQTVSERSGCSSPCAREKEEKKWEWQQRAPGEFRGRVRMGSFWMERLGIANDDMIWVRTAFN